MEFLSSSLKLVHNQIKPTFRCIDGLKIKSPTYTNLNKITFLRYIDKTCKLKEQISCSAKKINEINMQQNWDFSNEKDVVYFIEKHTTLLDKLISLCNTGILASPLKNINTRILQKVKKRKKDNEENMKKAEIKLKKIRNSLSPVSQRDKCHNFYNHKKSKLRESVTCENSKILYHNKITLSNQNSTKILKTKNDNQKDCLNHNLSDNMMNIMEKEIKIAKRLLQLYTINEEYIKRNVQVILHISKKSSYSNMKNQMKYNQMLCHHAILCLIEPSKKGAVLFEDDLSVAIKQYLLYGYKYNFEFQRDSEDCYSALLVLSQWAKVLVNHVNSTMMLTICGILECHVQNILVLYSPDEQPS